LLKKNQELQNFYQEWENNCPHAFYRVQQLVICTTSTVGYYCCLCGTFQRSKYKKITPPTFSHGPRSYIQNRRRKANPPMFPIRLPQIVPPAEINAPNFIGTVIESIYDDGANEKSEEEHYPIPPEHQAEVEGKKRST